MKKIFLLLISCVLFLPGCKFAPLSPDQNIDNRNGKIDEIDSNQNGVKGEFSKLNSKVDLMNSQLHDLMTAQNTLSSNNQNSGTQILQGDGAIILVFASIVISMILFYFYKSAAINKKSAEILANEITRRNDDQLNEEVAKAILYTNVEKHVASLLNWKK